MVTVFLRVFWVLLLAACAGLGSAHSLSAGEKRPNVVFFFIDTLRADRLHCYGNPRETSPSLDRLAERGTLFTNAVSQSSWSLPSYTTLFTSLYPGSHRVVGVDSALSQEVETLAEVLSVFEYNTVAFTGGVHLAPEFGLTQGFRDYRYTPSQGSLSHTVPAAVEWLRNSGGAPFFMMIHGYDVHEPFSAPLGFREMYDPDYRGVVDEPGFLTLMNLTRISGGTYEPKLLRMFEDSPMQQTGVSHHRNMLIPDFLPMPPRTSPGEASLSAAAFPTLPARPSTYPGAQVPGTQVRVPYLPPTWRVRLEDADIEHLRAHYDGGVTYADMWLGIFLENLRAAGLEDDTIVVVAGDHGEELGEHGRFIHAVSLEEPVIHVPLVIGGPGIAPGRRIDEVVGLIDLAPTVLELCFIPPSHQHQGRSLARFLQEKDPPAEDLDRAEFSSVNTTYCIRTARWHLQATQFLEISLWDLDADPLGLHDVSKANPKVTGQLTSRLLDWVERTTAMGDAKTANLGMRQKLLMGLLGYW